MESRDLEAWADALLDQHRTAPRPHHHKKLSLADLDPATRLMVETGAAPMPEPATYGRLQQPDPAVPMQRMYTVVGIAGGILLLLFFFTLLAA